MMKLDTHSEQRHEDLATAKAKIRLWQGRAELARLTGRTSDANRCDDKVRDWASKARQIEQGARPGKT